MSSLVLTDSDDDQLEVSTGANGSIIISTRYFDADASYQWSSVLLEGDNLKNFVQYLHDVLVP